MSKVKWLLIAVALLTAAFAIFFVLQSQHATVLHPKGLVAQQELRLIGTQIILMLAIIVPTFILIYRTAWKYRSSNAKEEHEPEQTHHPIIQILFWGVPSIVICVMAFVLWDATHKLDPYKPLVNDKKPLVIQVVAIDWKWLFIYPEEGIATVNYVAFPEKTPIHFKLTADSSPMNSFWIPQLSGQIYSMSGMVTPLYIIADEPGEFSGKAAEINGVGYAGMTFVAKASSDQDFQEWVKEVKRSPLKLDEKGYNALLVPSEYHPKTYYSEVDKDLFMKIVMKYM